MSKILHNFTDQELQDEIDRRELNKESPKTAEQYRILVDHINSLDDCKIWEYIIEHKDKILVQLDNDDTFAYFVDDEDQNIIQLTWYIGNSNGIEILLDAIGVKAEGV